MSKFYENGKNPSKYSRTSILVTPSVTHLGVTKIEVVTRITVRIYELQMTSVELYNTVNALIEAAPSISQCEN